MVHQEIDIKAAKANPPWLNSTSLVSIGGPDGISSVQMNFPRVYFDIDIFYSHLITQVALNLKICLFYEESTASLILSDLTQPH